MASTMRKHHKFAIPLTNSEDTGPMLDRTVRNVPLTKTPKEKLKYWRSLVIMTKLQLVLAALMILFESITDGVLTSQPTVHLYRGTCAFGTGIWVGVLGVIAAGLGLGAFKSPYGNKCLIVAHFVMGTISTVADGILIILVGLCLPSMSYLAHHYQPYYYYHRGFAPGPDDIERRKRERNIIKGVMANESLLIIVGIVHFIISIVSSAFICRNWCRSSEPSVAVVYLPSGAVGGHDGNETGSCRVQVPARTKMIFVPNENVQEPTNVKQEM